MKKLLISCLTLICSPSAFAQQCPQWPADCPETGYIENSQSRAYRIENLLLPQEVDMQDRMRNLFTGMMQKASTQLGWDMVEISEYTNMNGLQSGTTPYQYRSPRAITVTFQFVVDKAALQAWKAYETNYEQSNTNTQSQGYDNATSVMKGPAYQRYKDSADHYMKLYLAYIEKHKDEGAALYADGSPAMRYQQKGIDFSNKAAALTDDANGHSDLQDMEGVHDLKSFQYRNKAVLQVEFKANESVAVAIDQSLGPIESHHTSYPLSNATIAKIYTIQKEQENAELVKWQNKILITLGKFLTTPDEYGYYSAGFTLNGQDDEHTSKKIKSDKVQTISVLISGNKMNVEKMVKLINIKPLNASIVKF